MQGNQAVAEAALVAGVKVCAGYPITPSTEVVELLSKKLPAYGSWEELKFNNKEKFLLKI